MKKFALSTQIFIALVLAVVFGIFLQNNVPFANEYIKPFGTIFFEPHQMDCLSAGFYVHNVRRHFNERYKESRQYRWQSGFILYGHHCICREYRFGFRESF